MHQGECPAHALALEVNVDEVPVSEDERLVVLVLQVIQHAVPGVAPLLQPRKHHSLLPQIPHVPFNTQYMLALLEGLQNLIYCGQWHNQPANVLGKGSCLRARKIDVGS